MSSVKSHDDGEGEGWSRRSHGEGEGDDVSSSVATSYDLNSYKSFPSLSFCCKAKSRDRRGPISSYSYSNYETEKEFDPEEAKKQEEEEVYPVRDYPGSALPDMNWAEALWGATPDIVDPMLAMALVSDWNTEAPVADAQPIVGAPVSPPAAVSGDSDFLHFSWAKHTECSLDYLVPLARHALEHFNSTTNKNWSYEKVGVAAEEETPGLVVHMNFRAKSEDDSSQLLFAELEGDDIDISSSFFRVHRCWQLEESESADPSGPCCCMCWEQVIHPGPRYGYTVVAGDVARDCRFFYM